MIVLTVTIKITTTTMTMMMMMTTTMMMTTIMMVMMIKTVMTFSAISSKHEIKMTIMPARDHTKDVANDA